VIGPALAGDGNLQDTHYVIARILLGTGKRPSPAGGGGGMPAFGGRFSDAQVAAVATYVRNSWDNHFGAASASQVRQQWWGETVNGGELYANVCSRCHGENGGGYIGPALAGDLKLTQTSYVISQILHGGGGMPAFNLLLSNEQMAQVASYIRSSWGNHFGDIATSQVEKQRQAGKSGGSQTPGQFQAAGPGQLSTQASPLFENNCAVCHGNQGQGGVAPALAGDKNLADSNYVISRIVMGGGGMLSFNSKLSSEQIAKVASYIRTSWGNDFGAVNPAQVAQKHGGGQAAFIPPPSTVSGGPQAQVAPGGVAGKGAAIFVQQGCASCHGGSGEGGSGPKLRGDDRLKDTNFVITQILHGGGPMPAFEGKLSAAQIADVASYIRTSWGNTFGEVTEAQVKISRSNSSSTESGGGKPGGAISGGQQSGGAANEGAQLFMQQGCASCHGSSGEGGVGPRLAGDEKLRNTALVITQILHGGGPMPAFEGRLSAAQIADVSTYIRTSWGNNFGKVAQAQVENLGADLGGASGGQ
jgi:mono/diheme cytochrome c family protein